MRKNKERPKKKSKLITAVNKGANVLKFKATGKTISEAIDAGLKKLQIEKNVVEIRVLKQPQNFSLAEIEICVPREVVEKNLHLQDLKKLEVLNAEIKTNEQKLFEAMAEKDRLTQKLSRNENIANEKISADSPYEFAKKFIEGLLFNAHYENFEIESFEDENHINISVYGKKLGKLIGANGSRLAHIQYLANLALGQNFAKPKHIVLDINKFKAKETEKLKEFATQKANEVLEGGKEIALEPMNAFARRVVHGVVSEISGLATESVGEEPNRFIVISPKQKTE